MKPLLCLLLFMASGLGQTKSDVSTAGVKIIGEAFTKLSAALAAAIEKGGPAEAIKVCSETAPLIAGEVSKAHGVTLRRATTKARNPKNAADEKEQAILSSFATALTNKELPKPQTVTNADGTMSFYAPILIASPVCLKCHGTADVEVDAKTQAALKALYPTDNATGYKLGELRGLWNVSFAAPAK